jgi:hypothetical protein
MVLEMQNMTKSALRQAEQLAIRDCGGKELYRTLGDFLR